MRRIGAGALLFALIALGALAPAVAQPRTAAGVEISAVDAVVATAAAAAATQAAELANQDAVTRRLRANVDQLAAQAASGRATIAQLTTAREALIAELARRDGQYAQFIAGFRASVETIAETAEGRALLAQRRPGNLAAVRALLIDLAQARNAAIAQRANIERAANTRAVATIALDDRDRGEASTQEVIALYQEVTGLDPSVQWDWV